MYELHAVSHKEAVFACETDNIGNGSNGGKVAELLQSHSIVAAVKGSDQLQRDTCAAHKLEW